MKSRILRMALTWLAPLLIGYIVKKFEEKSNKKQNVKALNA